MNWTSLKPFPGLHVPHTKNYQITAGAEWGRSGLTLHYLVKAVNKTALHQIELSESKAKPERKDELWKTTCFESFIGIPGTEAYLEFNGSPSGDWNLYLFRKYREGMTPISVPVGATPKQITRSTSELELEVKWLIPVAALKPGFFSMGVSQIEIETVGLSIVLCTPAATTYWALDHHGVKPDFHLRNSFNYDPIRN